MKQGISSTIEENEDGTWNGEFIINVINYQNVTDCITAAYNILAELGAGQPNIDPDGGENIIDSEENNEEIEEAEIQGSTEEEPLEEIEEASEGESALQALQPDGVLEEETSVRFDESDALEEMVNAEMGVGGGDMLDLNQVIERTGRSMSNIYLHIKQGKLPEGKKVNGKNNWKKADVDAYIIEINKKKNLFEPKKGEEVPGGYKEKFEIPEKIRQKYNM